MDSKEAKLKLPEYKKILEMSGGHKPRKFVEAINVVECPAEFCPSMQGDCAYTNSFFVTDGKVTQGPAYSYESMTATGINPEERMVNVPYGTRMWIVTYDGMWGGSWSIKVYVNSGEKLNCANDRNKLMARLV